MKLPAILFTLTLALSGAVQAAPDMPELPKLQGIWAPVVGKGAVYRVTGKDESVDLQTSVVSEQADGVWLEEVVSSPKGELVVKALIGPDGVQSLVVQPPGKGPLLLPPMGAPGLPDAPSGGTQEDVSKKGELVAKESVTTPAGTFNTVHYKIDDQTHVWVTADIPPLGVVKLTSEDTVIVLKEVLNGVKTKITQEPKKLLP